MNKDFVISISSGVYTRGGGGTNKVIKSHQQMLNDHQISYFYICPVSNGIQKQLRLNTTGYWLVIIDGNVENVYSTAEVLNRILCLLDDGSNCLKIFIHHLKNVNVNSLYQLLECISGDILFYIHDYYTICNSCFLMKDDISYCGIGPISLSKCADCKYYKSSIVNNECFTNFFNKIENRLTFIAPSEAALNIWLSAFPKYNNKAFFVSHQRFINGEYKGNTSINAPIKIAFIGAANFEKGWFDFKKLVGKTQQLDSIDYYHLGIGGQDLNNVKHILVNYHSGLNAMIECIRKNSIDIALLWSLCPETYSYTYFEAYASNTIIISNVNSGNIAYQIKKNNNGFVFKNVDELIEFVLDPNFVKRIKEFKNTVPLGPADLEENDELVKLVKCSPNIKVLKRLPTYRRRLYTKVLMLTERLCVMQKGNDKK